MDPTYPLVPVVNLIAASLMLLTILITSLRQHWNTGVFMLCLWLSIWSLDQSVDTVVWSDNADNKAPVWCDISSHIRLAASVGVPACSLIITRRLCNIARLRTIDAFSKHERRIHCVQDLFVGIGLPILVMGPFYYVVQANRFQIAEDVGCGNDIIPSGLTTILVEVWPVILPLLSAVLYCPRIIWTFYRQRRDVEAFLRSNGSVDRSRYFRILAVGGLDILFTLPSGALLLLVYTAHDVGSGNYPLYPEYLHHQRAARAWAPVFLSAVEWRSNSWVRFDVYLSQWLYPILSLLIFAIFGLAEDARATYRRWFWTTVGLLGFRPPVREDMPDIKLDSPPHRRVRSLGHSISIPGSSTTGGTDLAISASSRQPYDDSEGGLADEVVQIAHESQGGGENGSVGTHIEQAREADGAGRDDGKEGIV
ncbi:pheromone A receptor-domain-containing protein [Amylostereum chailletii]|nr:pheromone A receptor-domain-containing protein [Amylostereum chailletii]